LITKQHFDALVKKHSIFKSMLTRYGYPPIWKRKNRFTTLVQIILEQQVSLASAYASYKKLTATFGILTPQKLIHITDEQFRVCTVSRQKASYIRNVATQIISKKILLRKFETSTETDIYNALIEIKGIGKWSIEVYLMMVLHYPDILPLGDIALVNEIKYQLKLQHKHETIENLVALCSPYKTAAAFLLYWSYINRKNITLPDYITT
jgi:DNA-3-methyladenine glycosylase II